VFAFVVVAVVVVAVAGLVDGFAAAVPVLVVAVVEDSALLRLVDDGTFLLLLKSVSKRVERNI
jgi:hypothetical protein